MNNKDSVLRTPSDYHSKDHSFNLTVSFKILLVPLLTVMMSCSVVGAFETDDPYGPVVNCDADQPMDDLLKCVEKEYAWMDRVLPMSVYEKNDRYFSDQYKQGKYKKDKRFYFPDAFKGVKYNEVSFFNSIKDCYVQNTCTIQNFKDTKNTVSFDQYESKLMATLQGDAILYYVNDPYTVCNVPKNSDSIYRLKQCKLRQYFLLGNISYRHFVRSYKSNKKDIIIFNQNGKIKVLFASLEVIKLRNNKKLIGIRFFKYRAAQLSEVLKRDLCEEKEKGYYSCIDSVTGGRRGVSEKIIENELTPVSAFTIWDIREEEIENIENNFAISLDRRENPSKIYVRSGNKVYEIIIPENH